MCLENLLDSIKSLEGLLSIELFVLIIDEFNNLFLIETKLVFLNVKCCIIVNFLNNNDDKFLNNIIYIVILELNFNKSNIKKKLNYI